MEGYSTKVRAKAFYEAFEFKGGPSGVLVDEGVLAEYPGCEGVFRVETEGEMRKGVMRIETGVINPRISGAPVDSLAGGEKAGPWSLL